MNHFDKYGGVVDEGPCVYKEELEKCAGAFYVNCDDGIEAYRILHEAVKLLNAYSYGMFYSVVVEKFVPNCGCCNRNGTWDLIDQVGCIPFLGDNHKDNDQFLEEVWLFLEEVEQIELEHIESFKNQFAW